MNEACTVKSILEASRTCLMAEANLATRQECLELHILHSCFSHSTHLHTYAQRGQQRVFRQVCLLLRSSNFKFFFFKWAVEGCCFSDKNFISSIFLRIRITIVFHKDTCFGISSVICLKFAAVAVQGFTPDYYLSISNEIFA